ncbi:hypothetical protein Tco_0080290 [Tanacetum coccineum]
MAAFFVTKARRKKEDATMDANWRRKETPTRRERKKERQIQNQKENKKKETMAAFFVTKARRKKEDATMDANWRRKETIMKTCGNRFLFLHVVSERNGSNNTTIHVTIIIQTANKKRKKERQIQNQKENKKKETMAAFFVTKARRKKEDATMELIGVEKKWSSTDVESSKGGSGGGSKSLYEPWKEFYDDQDPYDDDNYEACDLTKDQMMFCDVWDINLHGQIRNQKGGKGWRDVKEKQHSSANDAAKDTVVISSSAVDEPVVAVENTKDVNVGQTPISSTVDLNSYTSYAKLFIGESSRKSLNFHTLITPARNGTDVAVLSGYARVMIELRADVELKDTIVNECFKKIGSDVAKNLKNPTQAPKGVPVSPKMGFKPIKQVYRPVSKKNNANTSGNKTKYVESRKEVSNPNPFDVLNSVENDVDLGTNGTTPIIGNIDKLGRLIIDGKLTLVDDEDKPLEKVDYPGDHDSEDEVELIDNEMASFLQRGLAMVLIVCWNSEMKLMRMPIMTTPHTMMICMMVRKFLTTFNQYAIILISRYEVVKINRLLEIIDSFVV